MSGKLILVPTPIGNMADITLRALETLKSADLILAEDTRTTAKLLRRYDIHTPVKAFHQFNEHQKLPALIEELKAGKTLAVVSDAGTPGISDPGFLIMRQALREGIDTEVLPGPTAFVPALLLSGLPAERFVFEGFLPVKKGRASRLEKLRNEERTVILYESPHRLVKTLRQLAEIMGEDRPASVSRELTKKFEETRRGTLGDLVQHFSRHSPKGEFVIVVQGNKAAKKN